MSTEHTIQFHGRNLQAAIDKAKIRNGIVIYSVSPDVPTEDVKTAKFEDWGYWSELKGAIIRSWEKQVWPR